MSAPWSEMQRARYLTELLPKPVQHRESAPVCHFFDEEMSSSSDKTAHTAAFRLQPLVFTSLQQLAVFWTNGALPYTSEVKFSKFTTMSSEMCSHN